ncbi:hypothetical protein HMF7854_13980 [Sphingomonas ginkgonis]|uniref:Bacterial OB-fold domain-containing protein n=1 Tax=Sphingomonas ginkgonis TaxID=2315330 RepID=A0A3R9WRU2_9SPHN|nr:hypothetical protein [Sphingomonas ginkgonis]RST31821.1 hypothetical protein HMF7854_13980 [Sphingomonas ginkgonis]
MSDISERSARRPLHLGTGGKLGLAAAALLALGGAAGAALMAEARPTVTMAPASAVPIRSLSANGIVTIRGRVAEIYGNKFIMADASGRALVDTGREGDERQLVTAGEPVLVQGRFERGFVHAAFLVGPDSKVTALGPLAGPPHGRPGPHGGPDHGPGAPLPGDTPPPPSPPPAATAPAAPVAASAGNPAR